MNDKDKIATLRAIIEKQDEKILCLKGELRAYKDTYAKIEEIVDKLMKRCKK